MWVMTLLLDSAPATIDVDTALYTFCGPDWSFREDIFTGVLTDDLAVSPLQFHGSPMRSRRLVTNV